MIISLRFKNFFSLADDVVLDFTADISAKNPESSLAGNLIEFKKDRFINIIGIFGSNAAGKSNIIKAMDFCRKLVLGSHLYNEGQKFDFEQFKFADLQPSEFYINFIIDEIEYEYSFTLSKEKILSESLYYYPKQRRAKVFVRVDSHSYSYGKGLITRPSDIETATSDNTLFLSRASSMNRPIMKTVYRFFAEHIWVSMGNLALTPIMYEEIYANKDLLLKAFEISDSDIIDLKVYEPIPGQWQILSYHRENPAIAFDFDTEESEGTKRLLHILLLFIRSAKRGTAFFLDEFDLKMHLHLAEFLLDAVRASHKSQLVFTSHNQALINGKKLRPEQIVFVTKDIKGRSEFTPLSDYVGIDRKIDLEKSYLHGIFDGVPYIGDIYSVLEEML